MKKKLVVIGSAAVIAAVAVYLVFSINSYYPFWKVFKRQYPLSYYKSDYGTAESLEGKTVCVSLFSGTDDRKFDSGLKERFRENLGLAASWLTEQASDYGKTAEFVWDWTADPELCYDVDGEHIWFNFGLMDNDGYNFLWDFINNDVPSEELVEKFHADNIIYIAFFDRPENNEQPSFAHDSYFDREYSYDVAFIASNTSGKDSTASTVAHEILHLFGSPDMYKSGGKGTWLYGMNSDMTNYMYENYPDDLMLRTHDHETGTPYYGEVNGMISPITAYYVGLTDEVPQAVIDFGIDLSSHDPNRE